jgi:putative hydrolase of the HAD superfamily
MRTSPSAVIFDYGNVLSDSQPLADTQALAGILDLPIQQFKEIYWRFRMDYDAAALDPTSYWTAVAQSGSRALTTEQIATLVEIDARSWSRPLAQTPAWASRLRAAGLRTAILSNMPASVRDYVIRCSWLPEFDARIFSCDLGVTKPDPRMYRKCLDALRVQPSEALFFDDREANVRAAEDLGIHAILFTNAAEASRELRDRFSLPVTIG